MAKRGKVVAAASAAVAIAVLVATGIAAWPLLEEEWWLHRLRSGDEDGRQRAAEKLGELGSLKAVPALVAAMQATFHELVRGTRGPNGLLRSDRPTAANSAYFRAIVRIGTPALAPLIRSLGAQDSAANGFVIVLAIQNIHGMDIQRVHGTPVPGDPASVLKTLSRDGALSPEVREAADEALAKVQARPGAFLEGYDELIDINQPHLKRRAKR